MFQQWKRFGQWSVIRVGDLALSRPLDADAKGTRQDGDFSFPGGEFDGGRRLTALHQHLAACRKFQGEKLEWGILDQGCRLRVNLLFGGHRHGRPGDANAGQSAGHFQNVPGRDDQVAAAFNVGHQLVANLGAAGQFAGRHQQRIPR